MTGLDIAIIGVMLISALIGIVRGFTKELFSLFTWGGAVAVSWWMLPAMRGFVHSYIANPMIADGAAIFVIFILSLIILSIISNILTAHIRDSAFGGIDRSLGFGFGILRGVILMSAAELAFSTFTPRHAQSPTIQSSRFIHLVRNGGDSLLRILPASIHDMVLAQAIKVENQIKSQAATGALNSGIRIQEGSEEPISSPSPMLPVPQVMGEQQIMGNQQNSPPMTVIRDPQQEGTTPPPVPQVPPYPQMSPQNPPPRRLGESAAPQDSQSTADNLGRLQPLAPPKNTQNSSYRSEHRGDMQRLIEENLAGLSGEEG